MRYTQLRAFHFVAMHGGFSSAARALNQSQPSLSDHVRQLEQLHDTLLFHREKKHVRLTEAGDELFLLTRQFFDVEEQIGLCLSKRQHQLRGKLRMVADSALHITASLSAFRAANPKTFVSVQTGNSEDVLQRLRHMMQRLAWWVIAPPHPIWWKFQGVCANCRNYGTRLFTRNGSRACV